MHWTEGELDRLLFRRGLLADERKLALEFYRFAYYQLGIEMHPGQLAFAGMVLKRRNDSHVARYLTLMLTSGNRAGKTAFLAVLIIYCCLGKLNLSRPDESDPKEVEKWGRREYHWYHFGIRQEVSDLVFNDIIKLLQGTHEGQKNGCPMTEAGPIADWDVKEYSEYNLVKFRPEVGGAQVHFRTTGAKALGSLGKDMNGLTFDEAGIEPNLPFLVNEVFGFRRLGTGGQFIMVSTPSEELGTNFADLWEQGNPLNPDRLDSWFCMRMSTRDNIGFGLTQEMFDILTDDMDERTIQQNVEGIFLQARAAYFNGANVESVFVRSLPEVAPPRRGIVYLQGVDPAKTQDSAWSIVLGVVMPAVHKEHVSLAVICECKPYLVGVRASQKKGQKSTEALVDLAAAAHFIYDRPRLQTHCYTALDATGFGGKMFREALDDEVPNLTNVEFGGTVQKKRKLLGDLRTLIDEGRLLLPTEGIWAQVRKQLLNYRLEDRGIEQDAVMALVCAVYLLKRAPADGETHVPFDMSAA